MSFTDDEHAAIARAAAASGLSLAAWCAQACLALLDSRLAAPSGVDRQLATELAQARTQAIRIGTNLNQAVHKLNETGLPPDGLLEAAVDAAHATATLKTLAEDAAGRVGARP
ncbi:plasmid mobilization protein [Salsipaludibacter albus]|uniref:plasmid mobilization protein n=1 Tax=Salsipaludibacter albus TaxID=2849650 RepID=UPI001EE43DCB|nr:hypothetical protein [Salsipaludibacter albus]MBY5163282.1 plasmid mobilization relaxosome protein MobC [Salsipaludibacter albus]